MDLSPTTGLNPSPTNMSSATGSMTSSTTTMSNSSIYTNHVNVHLFIDKLDGTNYDTWASDIKLWLKSQYYVHHLTQCVSTVFTYEAFRWLKIDAQLCIVIKYIIHSSLKQFFHVFKTCSEVWKQAKLLYINDTQHFYGVCQNLLTVVPLNILIVQWLNIWVNYMLFFIILMNYCLMPPLLLKN